LVDYQDSKIHSLYVCKKST